MRTLITLVAVAVAALNTPTTAAAEDITDVLDQMLPPVTMGERQVWRVVDATLDQHGFDVTTYPFEVACTEYWDRGRMAVCYVPFRYDGDGTYRLLAGWFELQSGAGWEVAGWVER